MAPLDSPWHEWATALPGSVNKGPIPSMIILYVPLGLFLLQAAYGAGMLSDPVKKQRSSKFYATLIIVNIIAMSVVTGFMSLNGLLQGILDPSQQRELEGWGLGLWYITIGLFALFHSVVNCGRILYDSHGVETATKFIPVAVLLQGWQLVAIPFGLSPYKGLVYLMGMDYAQHLVALAYWSVKLHRPSEAFLDKDRLWYGIIGVVFHMIAPGPQIFYLYTTPYKHQSTEGLCIIYLGTVLIMFVSQWFWILMAMRTRPSPDPLAISKSERNSEHSDDLTEDASIWALL